MKPYESKRPRARVLSAVLAVFLGWAAGAGAAEPGGGAQPEGIKVHGHWTLDVRNPDGTLVSHHEVENALIVGFPGGPTLLAGLLGNSFTDPKWSIQVYGSPGPCGDYVTRDCTIDEASLTVNTPKDGGFPTGTLELSGSVTILFDSSLTALMSSWSANRGITVRALGVFSYKQLTGSIPVRQGQIVQVKVVFSFS